MFEKFSRSWGLLKASASVLRQDKELMVFPLVSTIAALIVVGSFIAPIFAFGWIDQVDEGTPPILLYAWLFLFYLVLYFVIFFFNTALVGAAMIRLRGGDPTVADGFRIAFGRIVPILGYAAIAATVGLLLRMLEERLGIVGRWISGLLGAAWTVASFLAVPVLVVENVGPVDAVKRSVDLLRRTWGENIIGNAGVGLAFFLMYLVLGLVAAAAVTFASSVSLVLTATIGALAVAAFVVLALVHASLSGIYAAALYRFAAEGETGGAFASNALDQAFRAR
ncbi:MAG TPA: DUF6159 family protein [Candidatus Saccharimonadia bacterium]|nr:DUF6159 family protein [Candidatus Saccharimonadia bacterium]